MKIKKYLYLFIAGVSVITSCKKSFLTELPPTSIVATTSIQTENDMSDAVNGMYNAMRSSSLFGRDIPVLGDLMGDDTYVFQTNSGRYLNENAFTFISTNAEASDIWNQGYYSILQANRIIANTLVPNSATVNNYKGAAYASRALTYLQLVNWFATPYTVSPTAAGIPLVTNVNFSAEGAFLKPSRSTVAAVYTKIISDLDSAYALITTTSLSSNYISKYAAKAIEARAYLYKGDYANAEAAAQTVVTSGGYSLTPASTLVTYWANPGPVSNKVETIFELSLTLTNNNGTNGLDYIYNQSGYGDILATNDLCSTYSATDVRRPGSPTAGNFLIYNTTKNGVQAYVVNKYQNVTNATDRDDIKIIRYAEVLLTLAEGAARTGDEPTALINLNLLTKMRDPSFTGYKSTGTQLVSDILTERRKELAFEGLRYFDLTRTNVAIMRPVQTSGAASISTVPIGDYRRLLPIPLAETNANKNITQNPGY